MNTLKIVPLVYLCLLSNLWYLFCLAVGYSDVILSLAVWFVSSIIQSLSFVTATVDEGRWLVHDND
jgi:hypothetical protein